MRMGSFSSTARKCSKQTKDLLSEDDGDAELIVAKQRNSPASSLEPA
jgi:hypothetical protein